jgi:hypothetical protein
MEKEIRVSSIEELLLKEGLVKFDRDTKQIDWDSVCHMIEKLKK